MKNWIHSETDKGDIVLSSKVQISRNIKGKKFLSRIDRDEARNIVLEFYNKIQKDNDKLKFIKSWESSQNELKYYKEREVATNKLIDNRDRSAVIINPDETLSVLLNEEDHVMIQGVSAGLDLEEIYKETSSINDRIEKCIPYEFNKQYGYLTCSINNLGTGLRISSLVHLPGLKMANKINIVKETILKNKIVLNEIYKDANIYRITSTVTLGLTEKQIVDSFKEAIAYVIKQENIERERLLSEKKIEIEDRVFRAYGILSYAKVIDSIESLKLLSDIRTGIELSFLNINKTIVNTAFINSRDSSIQRSLEEILSKDELDYERANVIRNIFTQN